MKAKQSYLGFYKLILDRVSFDQHLFKKEYRKALRLLTPDEQSDLDLWVQQKQLGK